MIRWVLLFLVISIIAGALGFGGLSQASADIAKFIFFGFLALLLIAITMLLFGRK